MTTTTPKTFYTPTGWAGPRYNRDLRVKDIAGIIRDYVKATYPDCKFSIVTRHHTSISVSLMSAPFDVFSTPDADKIPLSRVGDVDSIMSHWASLPSKGHIGVNHYYINDAFMLTDKARSVMSDVYRFMNSFNYDDSDIMTDYFDTNFYTDMSIGKWDKPFIRK